MSRSLPAANQARSVPGQPVPRRARYVTEPSQEGPEKTRPVCSQAGRRPAAGMVPSDSSRRPKGTLRDAAALRVLARPPAVPWGAWPPRFRATSVPHRLDKGGRCGSSVVTPNGPLPGILSFSPGARNPSEGFPKLRTRVRFPSPARHRRPLWERPLIRGSAPGRPPAAAGSGAAGGGQPGRRFTWLDQPVVRRRSRRTPSSRTGRSWSTVAWTMAWDVSK